jgi:hypothetical protein
VQVDLAFQLEAQRIDADALGGGVVDEADREA